MARQRLDCVRFSPAFASGRVRPMSVAKSADESAQSKRWRDLVRSTPKRFRVPATMERGATLNAKPLNPETRPLSAFRSLGCLL